MKKGKQKCTDIANAMRLRDQRLHRGFRLSIIDALAYDRFKSHRKNSVKDMDYKAELLEALDEKFGCAE